MKFLSPKLTSLIPNGLVTIAVLGICGWRLAGQTEQLQNLALQEFSLKSYLFVNEGQVRRISNSVTLNQLNPSFGVILAIQENQKTDLTQIRRYYRKIAEYYPEMSEAYVILGLCDYREGKRKEAFKIFQEGYEKDPGSFWLSYNLGAICLESGDLYHARIFFKHALTIPFPLTLEKMWASRLYRQIFFAFKLDQKETAQRLNDAYAACRHGLDMVNSYTATPASLSMTRPDLPKPKIF